MAESRKPPSTDTHIPPPPDPFPTYQTPYTRHTPDNENPFISFRRFADEQFNSFFSGIPRMLGVPIPASPSEFEVKQFEDKSLQQAAQFEAELNEMVRRRHEEAEGFRKQLEQEREERRMEKERRDQEDSVRWAIMQRGVEKCPALKPDAKDPTTELDMYDSMENQICNGDNSRRDCHWKHEARRGWLSGLGWDGKGRGRNSCQSTDRATSRQDQLPLNLEPEEHLANLKPFKHDDDLYTYLAESKYSPIHLMLPSCFMGWRESPDQTEKKIISELDWRMANHLQWSEAFNDLMSMEKTGELPPRDHASIFNMGPMRVMGYSPLGEPFWKEVKRLAEKTPRRESDFNDGLREGDFWDGDIDMSPLGTGIMALLMGAALSGIPMAVDRNNEESSRSESLQKQEEDNDTKPNQLGARGKSWPEPDAILSLIDRVRQLELESNSQDELVEDHPQAQPIHSNNLPSSLTSSTSTSAHSMSSIINNTDHPTSIISTLTTTQTRTLPDGTTETKRVLKRRFADGREECDESVEVRPGFRSGSGSAPSKVTPTIAEQMPSKPDPQISKIAERVKAQEQKKHNEKPSEAPSGRGGGGGWFWN